MRPIRSRNACCRRMRSLGLGKQLTYQLVDTFFKWESNNGPEWTADRLKTIKTDYIRHLAGKPPVGEWYAKHRDGRPKGPWGSLWKVPVPRALAALELSSTLLLQRVSEKQARKFISSVEREVTQVPPLQRQGFRAFGSALGELALMNHELARADRPVYDWKVPKLQEYPTSPSRRMPSGVPLGEPNRTVPETNIEEALEVLQWNSFTSFMFSHECTKDVVLDCLPMMSKSAQARAMGMLYDLPDDCPVGKISFIQEPSCKLRAVANPHRLLQLAMTPLWRHADRMLQEYLPADCTHDQDSGIRWVQEQLNHGKEIWSVDLSDATNNFPLQVQEDLLLAYASGIKDQRFQEDVLTFVAISRSPWAMKDPQSGEWTSIQWTQGQPLGLKPSFAVFALTHHAAMVIADHGKVSVSPSRPQDLMKLIESTSQKYRILGDDVVISDKVLYTRYRQMLCDLGCQISESKTLEAAHLGEFAGRVITADHVYRKPKWRVVSDDSFMEVCKTLGPRALHLLRPRQRRVVQHLAPLPVELGGLGWNPKGAPLQDRILDAAEFVFRSRDEYRKVFDSVKRIRSNVVRKTMLDPVKYEYLSGRGPGPTDQVGREAVISRILRVTGVTQASIPENIHPSGFISETSSHTVTLLQSLEKALGILDDATSGKERPLVHRPRSKSPSRLR